MKNSIKKFSVLILSLALVLCAFTLTVFGFNSAKADVVAEFSVYQMEESVSIKQVENGGIRFRVKMDANTKAFIDSAEDVTYGFIITPVYFYENRAAATDETYGIDDYIYSIAKYAGETGVGILGDKAKIYQEGEYYYANGVLEGIGKDSPDLKYIAIAYVKDGSGFHYATFDADNAIDIKTAASTIYLDGTSDIEQIRKIDILADFGTATNPVLISDNADMYALSTATNNGVITGEEDPGTGTVETINFKLLTDITFDCHATPVASGFAGAVDYNGKTIDLVNGGTNPIAHAFAGHTDDCTVCAPVESLITMTPKISNVISGTAWAESYVANEDFPYDCGDYTGDLWKLTPKSGIISIKVFYTADELTAFFTAPVKYNKVKFSYYINNPNGTSIYNTTANGTGVFNDEEYKYSSGKWVTVEMPIETVIANVSNGWLNLMGQGSGQQGTWDIYFSDFELIFDFDLLDADTATAYTSLRGFGSDAWSGTYKGTAVAVEDLPVAGYDGRTIKSQWASNYSLYATITFDMTNYEGMTVAEAITAYAESLGVTHIRVNYLIYDGGSITLRTSGVISSTKKGAWIALELTVSDFVSNLAKVSDYGNVTDSSAITGYDLFLFSAFRGSSAPTLYLGDIEFVQPVA